MIKVKYKHLNSGKSRSGIGSKRHRRSRGFTLIELTIGIIASTLFSLALGTVFVDATLAWGDNFEKAYSDINAESTGIKNRFRTMVRKGLDDQIAIQTTNPSSLTVYMYEDASSYPNADIFERLTYDSDAKTLLWERYYANDVSTAIETQLVSSKMTSCTFSDNSTAVTMGFTLTDTIDSSKTAEVITTAVMQNGH